MNEKTNASVAARPTPSAPAFEWNPRWQLIRAIAAPKKIALEDAGEDVEAVDVLARVLPVGERVDPQDLRADDRAADHPHEVGHQVSSGISRKQARNRGTTR